MLQLHQISLPDYCSETLFYVLRLLNNSNELNRPLKIIKDAADVAYELTSLLSTSVTPTIWCCDDATSLKICENLKTLFEYFSEIINYFEQLMTVEHHRITYLNFLWIAVKFISNLVPLEFTEQILPKNLKLSFCKAVMDGSLYLMFPTLHSTLYEYAKVYYVDDFN